MLLTNNFHDLQTHRVKIKVKLEQGEWFFKHLDNDIILFILSVFNSYAYFWDMLHTNRDSCHYLYIHDHLLV